MGRSQILTWQPGTDRRKGRWRKKYKNKVYYFDGGTGKSDRRAYSDAVKQWELKKLQIDANQPRRHQREHESAIEEWDQVLTWSNRHGNPEMAQLAHEKVTKLRADLDAPKLVPVHRDDRFDSLFAPPKIELPDDLIERAAADLKTGRVQFSTVPTLTAEDARRIADSSFGDHPLKREHRTWADRIQSQQRRVSIRQQSLDYYIDEYMRQKEREADSDELSYGRLYAIRLHLKHFQNWLGKDTAASDISSDDLRKYHASLVDMVTSGSWSSNTTARHYIVTMKAFIRWLWEVEAIQALPRVLGSKSDVLKISPSMSDVVIFTDEEISAILATANDRTKLFVLLMLNCGMTQKDISDLRKSDIDWEQGRITRKRSKTKSFENVPTVSYLLWPETCRLLRTFCDQGEGELALINGNGSPLLTEKYDKSGKYKKADNIKNAFDRVRRKLKITKSLKSFKKSSASRLRDSERFASLEDLFLGHAPQKMSDKHYTQAPRRLLDMAIEWLAEEYRITAETKPNDSPK